MAKAEESGEEFVGMIERGKLRLPEMQRRFVWRSTRVRDLLDSLYRAHEGDREEGTVTFSECVSARARTKPTGIRTRRAAARL